MKKSADLMSLLERICRTGRNPLPASRKLPGLLVREQPHRPVRPVVRGMTTGGSGITTIRENLRRQTQEPGKSTTGGQILFLSGQVDDRTILKYEKEAKDKSQESCYMAYIMDTIEEERVKGKTVEVGRAHFETEHTRFTILDAQDPVPNMISGASQADIGVLVISARKGDFETGYERGQTCEHVLLAKTLGIGKLVVLINEMDEPTVKWSKERYDEIEAKMVSFLKSSGYNVKKDVQFLPISGLVGTNIQTRMDKSICSWWDGPCFFEVLDCIEFPLHDPKCPVRTIVDKCKNMDKIKSGTIREGDSLLVMPNKSHAKFIGLNLDESKARCAGPAENVRVKLFKEDVMAGLVFPSAEKVGLRHGYHNKLFSRKFSHVPHQGTESSHELLKPDGNLPPKVILGNKTVLMQKIQNALSQNIQKLNKVSLEHRYQTEFRPKLSCSGLLLPKGLNSDSTAFLHHQHHKQNRKTPQYLSAYELMIQRLRINNEDEWGHFWDQIINSRIFIVDTWDENVGNVETLHYDYGIKGSFKGEVDASFHDGKQGKKGTARISFVLWREDKVVCAEVYENLKCSSIHMAEGYAALALVFKCIELNITELVIWTDNVDIQGCITGSYTVKQIEEPSDLEKEHRNLFDLLGCMRNSFTLLRAMCKPRELMFLVDDLSTSEGGIPKLEDAIKKFNYQLSQKAIFKFSHAASAKAIIKSFGYCMFVRRHETKFFVLVDNLDKLDAVAQITDALCPSGVYIAVQQLDEKPLNFQIRLQQMVGSNLRHQSSVDDDRTLLHYSTKDNGMELLIIVDGTVPHGTYDCLGCFTVILVSSMERKQLDPAISEFNALSYRYFMGVAV